MFFIVHFSLLEQNVYGNSRLENIIVLKYFSNPLDLKNQGLIINCFFVVFHVTRYNYYYNTVVCLFISEFAAAARLLNTGHKSEHNKQSIYNTSNN